jgi:hypothetical protein
LAAQGSFAFTGYDAILTEYKAFTLAGQDAGFAASRLLTAGQGSFVLSGQDANLLAARVMAAGQGSFVLTGFDVELFLEFLQLLIEQDAIIVQAVEQDAHIVQAVEQDAHIVQVDEQNAILGGKQ